MNRLKLFALTLWAVVVSTAGYMIYTGDLNFLNVTTAYYVCTIALGFIGCLFLAIGLSYEDSKEAGKENLAKVRENITGWHFLRSTTNLVVLAMLNYEWLLGLYLVLVLIHWAIVSSDKEE